MRRVGEIKVGQAVVDQVQRQIATAQQAIAQRQAGGVHHHGLDAMALEQLGKQRKLGRQVLAHWRFIHNGHAVQGPQRLPPGLVEQVPLGLEHGHKLLLQRGHVAVGIERRIHQPAAHGLRAQQHRVEHGTAGVGVDFDELRALWGDVKVVAHEHAQRAMVFLRNRPCSGQYLLRPGGQGERALQGRHGVLDRPHRGL